MPATTEVKWLGRRSKKEHSYFYRMFCLFGHRQTQQGRKWGEAGEERGMKIVPEVKWVFLVHSIYKGGLPLCLGQADDHCDGLYERCTRRPDLSVHQTVLKGETPVRTEVVWRYTLSQ